MRLYLPADPARAREENKVRGEVHQDVSPNDVRPFGHDLVHGQSLVVYTDADDIDGSRLSLGEDYRLVFQDGIATDQSRAPVFRRILFLRALPLALVDYHAYGDLVGQGFVSDVYSDLSLHSSRLDALEQFSGSNLFTAERWAKGSDPEDPPPVELTEDNPGSDWIPTRPSAGMGEVVFEISALWRGNVRLTAWNPPMVVSGLPGPSGDQGIPGPAGEDGSSIAFHVAYAFSADGAAGFNQEDGPYIGTYSDTNPTDSSDYHDYVWRRFQGTQGPVGIPGTPGSDGRTPYLHLKYSNDGASFTANGGEDAGSWLGTLVDFVVADSTVFADYKWKKIEGPAGPAGGSGPQGAAAKAYRLEISGGVRAHTWDASGANPNPSAPFGVTLYEDGVSVIPTSRTWRTPGTTAGLLSGSGTGITFTPTVAATFDPVKADNWVECAVVYGGNTYTTTVPVSVAKVGQTGNAGTPATSLRAYSWETNHGGNSEFVINQQVIGSSLGRGHTLRVINPATMTQESAECFDTYGVDWSAQTAFIAAINAVPAGRILVLHTADACAVSTGARAALVAFGGDPGALAWAPQRMAHVFVGMRGFKPGTAVEKISETSGVDSGTISVSGDKFVSPSTPVMTWTPVLLGGVTMSANGVFRRTAGIVDWNASVRSEEGFPSCTLAFYPGHAPMGDVMMGLNSDPGTNDSYNSLDFSWYMTSSVGLEVYENGGLQGNFGSYDDTTKLSITWEGANVRYSKNGVVVRTVAYTGSKLYLDSSFASPNAGSVRAVTFGNLVVATEIQAGTITADRIAGKVITADQIAGGAISANELAAGAVTTDKMTAGSINADRLTAGSITADRINVTARSLINDLSNPADGLTGWYGALERVSWGGKAVLRARADWNPYFYSNTFYVGPQDILEFTFGLNTANYTGGSGLYLGLTWGQNFRSYVPAPNGQGWLDNGVTSNQYFVSDYISQSPTFYRTYILGCDADPARLPGHGGPYVQALKLQDSQTSANIRSGYNAVNPGVIWDITNPKLTPLGGGKIVASNIEAGAITTDKLSANLIIGVDAEFKGKLTAAHGEVGAMSLGRLVYTTPYYEASTTTWGAIVTNICNNVPIGTYSAAGNWGSGSITFFCVLEVTSAGVWFRVVNDFSVSSGVWNRESDTYVDKTSASSNPNFATFNIYQPIKANASVGLSRLGMVIGDDVTPLAGIFFPSQKETQPTGLQAISGGMGWFTTLYGKYFKFTDGTLVQILSPRPITHGLLGTWPCAFADTNYAISVSFVDSANSYVVGAYSLSATQYAIHKGGGGSFTGTIMAIGRWY